MATDPYEDMTDEQVLARARTALIKASVLEPGSIQRAIQWAVYDSCKMELDRRMMQHVLGKLRDRGEG